MLIDQATAYVLRKLRAWSETVWWRGTVNSVGGWGAVGFVCMLLAGAEISLAQDFGVSVSF